MLPLGMISSPPDERDYSLSKAVAYAASPISDIVTSFIPPFIDQGSVGCCVAVSAAKILGCIERKQRGFYLPISIAHIFGKRKGSDFQGDGMIPREAGINLTRWGSPRYELLPGILNYEDAKRAVTPALDGEGIPNRPLAIVRLNTLQDIYDYIRIYDLPFWFGFEVYSNIGSGYNVPAPSGTYLGNHMVTGVGVRASGEIIAQHSWKEYGAGADHLFGLNLSEHKRWECWGFIPETSDSIIKRPQDILMTIGNPDVYVDSQRFTLDTAPIIDANGRTLVPLRFVAEQLGGKVKFVPIAGGKPMVLIQFGGEFEKVN